MEKKEKHFLIGNSHSFLFFLSGNFLNLLSTVSISSIFFSSSFSPKILANRLSFIVALYLYKQLECMNTPELNLFVPQEIDMADACPKELIVDECLSGIDVFDFVLLRDVKCEKER